MPETCTPPMTLRSEDMATRFLKNDEELMVRTWLELPAELPSKKVLSLASSFLSRLVTLGAGVAVFLERVM